MAQKGRVSADFKVIALTRDGHKCLMCKTSSTLTLHHAFELYEHRLWAVNDVWNFITLCRHCHDKLHGFVSGSKPNAILIRKFQRIARSRFQSHPWRWIRICNHLHTVLRTTWAKVGLLLEANFIDKGKHYNTYSTRKERLPIPEGCEKRHKHIYCTDSLIVESVTKKTLTVNAPELTVSRQ